MFRSERQWLNHTKKVSTVALKHILGGKEVTIYYKCNDFYKQNDQTLSLNQSNELHHKNITH